MTDEPLDQTSMLLMYLAGELPARQRAELDRRVSADAGLRAQLDVLRGLQSEFESSMRTLDAATARRGNEQAAIARITRAMHAQGVVRTSSDEALLMPRRILHRPPAWAYPIAAAILVGLSYVGWWAFKPEPRRTVALNTGTEASHVRDGSASRPSSKPSGNEADSALFAELEQSFTDANPTQAQSLRSLRVDEREASDLSVSRSDPLQALFSDPSFDSSADE
jgi:hypothetical protein